nr:MAG TPA: hypothetical protein [Caudoviricetes sp.]
MLFSAPIRKFCNPNYKSLINCLSPFIDFYSISMFDFYFPKILKT